MAWRQAGAPFAGVIASVIASIIAVAVLTVDELNFAVQEWTGGASNLSNLEINDWAPTGIQDHTFIVTRGADNEGTRITGIDATNIEDGAVRYFVNLPTGASPPTDSGTLTFVHESSLSAAANRIQTPGAVDCTFPMYAIVGLVYGGLDGSNPTQLKRWRIMSNCGWTGGAGTTAAQMLRFFPSCSVGDPTPISGTFHDYRPTCLNLAFNAGYWLAGSKTDSWDYSVLNLYVDAAGATLTGLYTSATQTDPKAHGPIKVVRNMGPGTLTLKHLNAGSSANLRFNLPRDRDLVLKKNEAVILFSPLHNAIDLSAQWFALQPSNEQFPSVQSDGTLETNGAWDADSVESPAALASGETNDYNPGSREIVWRLSAHASNSRLSGIVAPALTVAEVHMIHNVGTGALVLEKGDVSSTAENRFDAPADVTIPALGSVWIWYDTTSSRWRVFGWEALPRLNYNHPITPAAHGGTQNNYAPTDCQYHTVIRESLTSAETMTGLSCGQVAGDVKKIIAYSQPITFTHADTNSSVGNRFSLPSTLSYTIPTGGSVELWYDAPNQSWLVIGSSGGQHVESSAPSVGTCGTGPTVTGFDTATGGHSKQSATITTGTGGTGCTVTFKHAFSANPDCVISPLTGTQTPSYSRTTTALTLTGLTAGSTYSYHCQGPL